MPLTLRLTQEFLKFLNVKYLYLHFTSGSLPWTLSSGTWFHHPDPNPELSLSTTISGLYFTLSTLPHLVKCLPFTSLNLFFSPLLATSSRKKSVCTTVHLFSQLLVPSKAHSLLRITPISSREEGAFPIQRTMT